MNDQECKLIHQDLRVGGDILRLGGTDWRMVKKPEPILYVLAKRALSSSNDWISGKELTQDLVALRRDDGSVFNPHGWLAKTLTDFRRGKSMSSEALTRWAPYIERTETQPYSYRLTDDLYRCVKLYDFGEPAPSRGQR